MDPFSVSTVGDMAKFIKEWDKDLNKHFEKKVGEASFKVERETKLNLKNNKSVSSGNLIRSYSTHITRAGKSSTGDVGTNAKYAVYVERGTRPHWPPIGPLKRWAAQRGVNPYAVAASIAQKGTKAHPHLFNAFDKVLARFDWWGK